VLEAMRGDFDTARELLAAGRRALDELGQPVWVAVTGQEAFFVEMLAGDPAAAARTLRQSYETLSGMGERSFRSTIAGLLAHALCELGEDDEADQFSRACEEAAAEEDVFSQVLWRSARAKVLARRGEADAAEAAAREAVAIAERTDLLNTQADALLDLAEVLAQAGRSDEARAAARDAADRFERKGNLPSLERARELSA
jgi:ATP/maltotriose-dependent transcriptional regulator MalT